MESKTYENKINDTETFSVSDRPKHVKLKKFAFWTGLLVSIIGLVGVPLKIQQYFHNKEISRLNTRIVGQKKVQADVSRLLSRLDEVDKKLGNWGLKRLKNIKEISDENAEGQSSINEILRIVAEIYPGAAELEKNLIAKKDEYDQSVGNMIEKFDAWQGSVTDALRALAPHMREYDFITRSVYIQKLKAAEGKITMIAGCTSGKPSQHDLLYLDLRKTLEKKNLKELEKHLEKIQNLKIWVENYKIKIIQ